MSSFLDALNSKYTRRDTGKLAAAAGVSAILGTAAPSQTDAAKDHRDEYLTNEGDEKPGKGALKVNEGEMPYTQINWGISLFDIPAVNSKVLTVDPDDILDSAGLPHDDIDNVKQVLDARRAKGQRTNAYLSIGEAETYRDYYNDPEIMQRLSGALDGMEPNPEYPDNIPIRFWDENWLELTKKRVERLVDQGYDGAFLDKVDIYTYISGMTSDAPSDPAKAMTDFIEAVNQHAAAYMKEQGITDREFRLIANNPGAELIKDERFVENTGGYMLEDQGGISHLASQKLAQSPKLRKRGYDIVSIEFIGDAPEDRQRDYFSTAIENGIRPFIAASDYSLNNEIPEINLTLTNEIAAAQAQSQGKAASKVLASRGSSTLQVG